jgi:hypothetical protein
MEAYMDAYCERTGPGLLAEPLDAITNGSFLIAAWAAWLRATRTGNVSSGVRSLVLLATSRVVVNESPQCRFFEATDTDRTYLKPLLQSVASSFLAAASNRSSAQEARYAKIAFVFIDTRIDGQTLSAMHAVTSRRRAYVVQSQEQDHRLSRAGSIRPRHPHRA